MKDPVEDFEVNARGTLNILEAMRTVYSSAKLIYASTNKVYGSLSNIDVTEEANRYVLNGKKFGISEDQPLDFHSPYGCSKGAADQYIHDYSRIYGLDTVVFRQSCIYGPRQFGVEDQGWVAWFMIALVLGKQITIYGNGKQVRDLLFIDDLIEAYSMAVSQKLVTKGKVYNIGGGMENTISVWAEFKPVLEELFSKTIEANFEPERPGDQPTYVSDIRKAQREFGWVPKTGLREGIKILHNWITANKKLFL